MMFSFSRSFVGKERTSIFLRNSKVCVSVAMISNKTVNR